MNPHTTYKHSINSNTFIGNEAEIGGLIFLKGNSIINRFTPLDFEIAQKKITNTKVILFLLF